MNWHLLDWLTPLYRTATEKSFFSLSLSHTYIEMNLVMWVALTAINEVLCVARVLCSWSLCTFGFYAQYFQVVFSFISFTPLTICPSICEPLPVEFDAFSQMVYSTPTFNTNRNIKTSHLPIKPLWSMYLCVCGQQPNIYRLTQHPLSLPMATWLLWWHKQVSFNNSKGPLSFYYFLFRQVMTFLENFHLTKASFELLMALPVLLFLWFNASLMGPYRNLPRSLLGEGSW